MISDGTLMNSNQQIECLKTVQSQFGPAETVDRFESSIKLQGMQIFARIEHSRLAADVGLTLRPTILILFGNPRSGTPLMQAAQTIGIDLPLKALVWEDDSGKTWLSYNDVEGLIHRHGIAGFSQIATLMNSTVGALAAKLTSNRL